MLYKLIRNSITNSCLCTHMVNKNKHQLMYSHVTNSILQFRSGLGPGHTCSWRKIIYLHKYLFIECISLSSNALNLIRSSGEEGGSRAGRKLLQYIGGAPFNIATHTNKKMDFLVAHSLHVMWTFTFLVYFAKSSVKGNRVSEFSQFPKKI
jgi:hypothetical protein